MSLITEGCLISAVPAGRSPCKKKKKLWAKTGDQTKSRFKIHKQKAKILVLSDNQQTRRCHQLQVPLRGRECNLGGVPHLQVFLFTDTKSCADEKDSSDHKKGEILFTRRGESKFKEQELSSVKICTKPVTTFLLKCVAQAICCCHSRAKICCTMPGQRPQRVTISLPMSKSNLSQRLCPGGDDFILNSGSNARVHTCMPETFASQEACHIVPKFYFTLSCEVRRI